MYYNMYEGLLLMEKVTKLLLVSGFLEPLLHGRNIVEMYCTTLQLPVTCGY